MYYLFVAILLFSSATSRAHEVFLSTQVVDIKKQNVTGKQVDALAKATVSEKFEAGLQATYLERFNLFEKRAGAFVIYRPKTGVSLELKHLRGRENELLPETQTSFAGYFSIGDGITPFVSFTDARYSATTVNYVRLGTEIEKLRNIILIPQVMSGRATFRSPAETEEIYAYGLRAVYYREEKFSVFIFGSRGREASQGVIGVSNILVSTRSGGIGGSYFLTKGLKAELVVDHTDYEELGNQFVTTAFNLQWVF